MNEVAKQYTTDNMAMQFFHLSQKTERTLALPSGLTAEQAIEWAKQWQGPAEVMVGIVSYR